MLSITFGVRFVTFFVASCNLPERNKFFWDFLRQNLEDTMAKTPIEPHLVMADAAGNIYDHPELLMLCRRGGQWGVPRPDELMPLPPESELFLLPGRHAAGLNQETGEIEILDDLAVAAFAAPAHTLGAHPCYVCQENAPVLPLFAYGAVGYARGRFYICAKKVDDEERQVFADVPRKRLEAKVRELLKTYPQNRLMQHIMNNCVLRYDCPAARNLALGRYEAPLPTSRSCNARCIGCISHQEDDSPIQVTPQCRLAFRPTVEEVVEIMRLHSERETEKPVYSFGQGCEGDPLTEGDLLVGAIQSFRREGGEGTINCNTNASRPEIVAALADAGLSSMRVSLNSAREDVYTRYYRPQGYSFSDVRHSIHEARTRGIFVSLNLLYFPGVTDTEEEMEALIPLIGSGGVSFVQLRNLNIDPDMYWELLEGISFGPAVGLVNFRKRLRKACPWLRFGYFNPYVGTKAVLTAPEAGTWQAYVPSLAEVAEGEENMSMEENGGSEDI